MKSVRLRHVAQVNPPSPAFDRLSPNAELTFLPMESIWPDSRLDISQRRTKSSVATGYTRFQDGDVLVPKITPTFEAGRSVLIHNLHNGTGAGTTELHILRAGPQLDPRFLLYLTQTPKFLKLGKAEMYGVAGQQRVPDEFIRNLTIHLPPLPEQRRIADFLDIETEHIKKIYNRRLYQKNLVHAWRWSSFESMVNQTEVRQTQLRRVLLSITDGPFGSAFSSSDYTDEGASVVRLGNIGFAEYRHEGQARIPLALLEKFRTFEVKEGDLLIAGLGDTKNHAGRACVAPDISPAIVKGKCFRARVNPSLADARFIALLLSSTVGAAAVEGRGSTRSMINLEIVKSAILPLPELSDQKALSIKDAESSKLADRTAATCDRQLRVLAERRGALIAAAVMGRIDATTASGRGVTEGISSL